MQPYPLRLIKNLNRGREIATVLLNYGFVDVLDRAGLRRYLKLGRRWLLRKPDLDPEVTTSRRIRLALQDLGPTFIKFGQVLSTRPDLVPHELIEELSLLQEHVPPFPGAIAAEILEREFQRPLSELYASFDQTPLAAGSLAQVHRAIGKDGSELAIKIRRPQIVSIVERDLGLMLELAQLLERHIPESHVFDPIGLVQHFTRTIRREMNFRREARAMQDFARMFADDRRLYVPRVDDALTSEAVLTMECIGGCKPDDVDTIRACRVEPGHVARAGAEIFLKQAFEFGFFHGDPHPGNMRVRPDGSLVLLDFGMVGYLDDDKREQLVDLFVAISRHDVDAAVQVVLDLGDAARPVERELLQADVRDFIDTYYGVSLEQMKVGPLLNDFISVLASHGLRVPGDLMVLVRAIVTLEGVGRQLDPHFNFAEVLTPYVERLIRRRYDPRRMAERAADDLKSLFRVAHDLPLHLGRTLQKISQDDFKIQLEHRGLDKLINEFDRSSNRLVIGLVTSALIVSTALVLRTTSQSFWLATPLFILSGLLGVWLIWGILRSGRL